MPNIILSDTSASISELKKNPMATVSAGDGFPVAILNRNQPAFYCIPAGYLSMTYTVKFREDALKEWQKLDKAIQQQFAKKLKKCCDEPHIPSAKLRGIKDCYKIKLRASGFRLVYQVIDDQLIIAVVAVGKRERSDVYNLASERMR